MYKIKQRYQRWSRDGITWSEWYIWDQNVYDEAAGKEKIKENYAATKKMDQVSGLKHEFELVKVEE